jgi:hypothetical protein
MGAFMDAAGARREAQLDALISIVGSILAVLDVHSDAADLWPETMRRGTPDEIRQVTAELAEVLPAALFKELHPANAALGPADRSVGRGRG